MRKILLTLSLFTGVIAAAPLLATEASAAPVLVAPTLQAATAVSDQAAVESVQYRRYHRRYVRRHGYYRRY